MAVAFLIVAIVLFCLAALVAAMPPAAAPAGPILARVGLAFFAGAGLVADMGT